MIKTCIISCGMIANNAHIPAYRTFPEDYELAGVCDVDEHIAMETAKRHGIPKYYTDAKSMLAELRPDLVSVCVPNALHKQYAMMALQMGAHVLCEKPLAFRLQDAEELYACAENSKKMLMACQNRRYSPDRLAAKRFIENGGLDDIYYGEIVWIPPPGDSDMGYVPYEKNQLRRCFCGYWRTYG